MFKVILRIFIAVVSKKKIKKIVFISLINIAKSKKCLYRINHFIKNIIEITWPLHLLLSVQFNYISSN